MNPHKLALAGIALCSALVAGPATRYYEPLLPQYAPGDREPDRVFERFGYRIGWHGGQEPGISVTLSEAASLAFEGAQLYIIGDDRRRVIMRIEGVKQRDGKLVLRLNLSREWIAKGELVIFSSYYPGAPKVDQFGGFLLDLKNLSTYP